MKVIQFPQNTRPEVEPEIRKRCRQIIRDRERYNKMKSQKKANTEMLIVLIVFAVVIFFLGYAIGVSDASQMIVDGYEGVR